MDLQLLLSAAQHKEGYGNNEQIDQLYSGCEGRNTLNFLHLAAIWLLGPCCKHHIIGK